MSFFFRACTTDSFPARLARAECDRARERDRRIARDARADRILHFPTPRRPVDRGRAQALPARPAEARQGARAFSFPTSGLFLERRQPCRFPARARDRRARGAPGASVPWRARDPISFPGAFPGCPAVDIARATTRPTLRCPRHTRWHRPAHVRVSFGRDSLRAQFLGLTARRRALPASRSGYGSGTFFLFFLRLENRAPRSRDRGASHPPAADPRLAPPLVTSYSSG